MKGKIFNTQEVQSIIVGNKRTFREVVKPQPREGLIAKLRRNRQGNMVCMQWQKNTDDISRFTGLGTDICKVPYQVGQKIFVKEKFYNYKENFEKAEKLLSTFPLGPCTIYKNQHYGDIIYETDGYNKKMKPAQHMKQEHSRITLEIKEIRVERLQDISEEDAIAEGIPLSNEFKDRYYTPEDNYAVPKIAFMRWWNATHKKPEEKFEASPWVWKVEMEVVK